MAYKISKDSEKELRKAINNFNAKIKRLQNWSLFLSQNYTITVNSKAIIPRANNPTKPENTLTIQSSLIPKS